MGQAPAAADTLLKGEGLPDYQAITPEAVSQGMPWLLEQLEAELARIEASLESPSASAALGRADAADAAAGGTLALELGGGEPPADGLQHP